VAIQSELVEVKRHVSKVELTEVLIDFNSIIVIEICCNCLHAMENAGVTDGGSQRVIIRLRKSAFTALKIFKP
jgi:hypothetical protein